MRKIAMRQIAVGIAAIAALIGTPALAADMAIKAPAPAMAVPSSCVWCGWYVGVNVGGGWSESTGNLATITLPAAAEEAAEIPVLIANGVIPLNLGVKSSGVIGGGQIGYNWQSGAWVFGLETDIQGSGIRGSNTINTPGFTIGAVTAFPLTYLPSDKLDWFGTARVRVGVAVQSTWLLYATGGLAYGATQDSTQINALGGTEAFGSVNQTRAGWIAGGGTEWMFSPRWSVKAEYLFMDLGSNTVAASSPEAGGGSLVYRFAHRYNIARIGVNLHF